MSKSVRPKDLTDKISCGLTKYSYFSAAYFIVRTDKIFKISWNDWHVPKDFNISAWQVNFRITNSASLSSNIPSCPAYDILFFSFCSETCSETPSTLHYKLVVKRLRRRQYDPAIIERTIGLVLGPFTALYRSFLKRCTLTNTAVGTIWRALSKPPQRRQGPDPRPLWLLVGTPSAFGPELAYRLRVAQPTLMDVTRYFWYTFILLYMSVYYIFMTSPLWLAVGPQST